MPQTLPDNVVDLRSAPTLRVLAGGGEPPHDGGMEARVAVVENEVKHVRDAIADVRADVGAIIPALTKFKDDVNAEFKELLIGCWWRDQQMAEAEKREAASGTQKAG